MEKKSSDYSKSIIYQFKKKDGSVSYNYIGSTRNFIARKAKHKNSFFNVNDTSYNQKLYTIMRENGGWNEWVMIEIEKFPCKDKNELRAREQYWFERLQPTINKNRAFLTEEQKLNYNADYYENNKEKMLEHMKLYYENNKEKMLEHMKLYYETNKEKCLDYYKNNKEKYLDYRKEYYDANKDEINKKYDCVCGSVIMCRTKNQHETSLKHNNFIQQQPEQQQTTI